MESFTNKIEFSGISRDVRDVFLELLTFNKVEIARKQITPIYKVQFQGKLYFNNVMDYMKARKLFKEAKEIIKVKDLEYLEKARVENGITQ